MPGINAAENALPIKTAYSGVACTNCMESERNLLSCSACKLVRYCCKSCQKTDWKKHKGECKILTRFKELYPNLPGNTMNQKAAAMIAIVEEDALPRGVHWERTKLFLHYGRVCSVCSKSQYEMSLEEQKNWVSCPKCKFGWCCSEDHWTKYKDRHTDDICASYMKSIAMSRFFWNHMKEYDDTFKYQPDSMLSQPMSSLPGSWNGFFETRDPFLYQTSSQGMLPAEFLPVATRELSQPLTCLYAMYSHDRTHFLKAETLTVHIAGASPSYEMVPTCIWEELMHCLPSVKTMRVDFVGPEACKGITPPVDEFGPTESECCPGCREQKRSRQIYFYGKTYHEYRASDTFSTPDLVIAFNTGMHEEDVESWKESLGVILDMDVPSMFTSYNRREAEEDFRVLKRMNARTLTDAPILNPFRCMMQEIDSDRSHGNVDQFFQINMYAIGFKGRE